MWAYLEVHGHGGHGREEHGGEGSFHVVPLGGTRVTLGRALDNDVALDDGSVSRAHAVLERYETGWCVRDQGSFNGTWVNGRQVQGAWLQPDDEILVGESRLVFRVSDSPDPATVSAPGPPRVSAEERRLLLALCRPLVQPPGQAQGQPPGQAPAGPEPARAASVAELARELGMGAMGVRQRLDRLCERFGVGPGAGPPGGRASHGGAVPRGREARYQELAAWAIRRRAVTLGELRQAEEGPERLEP